MNYTKTWIIFFLLFFSLNALASSMNYDLTIQGNDLTGTIYITLESETNVNYFSASIILPENTELISLKDSKRKITDYSINDNILSFKTNKSIAKKKETINASIRISDVVKKEFNSLNYIQLSLSGLPESETTVTLRGKKFYSFEASNSFKGKITATVFELKGSGPTSITLTFSDETPVNSEHYTLLEGKEFENNILNAEELFYIIPRITGITLPYERIPVLIFDDKHYESIINDFSEGVYTRGAIILKESSFKENPEALLLHETTHAFNAQVFNWNKSESSWFDEGIAQTTEALIKQLKNKTTHNLFYPDKKIIQGNKITTYYPRSSIEKLKEYYEKNDDSLFSWNPGKGENEFYYALSELIIRNTLKTKNWSVLTNAYNKFIEIKKNELTEKEFNEKILELLELNLKPCSNLNDSALKECLEKINEFKLSIPIAINTKKINSLEKEIVIKEQPSLNLEKQEIILKGLRIKTSVLKELDLMKQYLNEMIKPLIELKYYWVIK